jgi:hypothetical protein
MTSWSTLSPGNLSELADRLFGIEIQALPVKTVPAALEGKWRLRYRQAWGAHFAGRVSDHEKHLPSGMSASTFGYHPPKVDV